MCSLHISGTQLFSVVFLPEHFVKQAATLQLPKTAFLPEHFVKQASTLQLLNSFLARTFCIDPRSCGVSTLQLPIAFVLEHLVLTPARAVLDPRSCGAEQFVRQVTPRQLPKQFLAQHFVKRSLKLPRA